jgi:nucleotide-binding universal stress UspA family protein
MASHGRGRSAALLGSVASEVAASASGPMLVLGPDVPADHRLTGDVVACVDGSETSERVVPVAAAWASALGLGLAIVTVAEPVPQAVTPGASYRRSHGPSMDAEDYLGQLAARWRDRGTEVATCAIYDPVSVVGGLAEHFKDRPPALMAATTHARTGLARLTLGSVAAGIVHRLAAPVLLVPGGYVLRT